MSRGIFFIRRLHSTAPTTHPFGTSPRVRCTRSKFIFRPSRPPSATDRCPLSRGTTLFRSQLPELDSFIEKMFPTAAISREEMGGKKSFIEKMFAQAALSGDCAVLDEMKKCVLEKEAAR